MKLKPFIKIIQFGSFLHSVAADGIQLDPQTNAETVSVPLNFSLSFTINPKKTSLNQTNIVNFKRNLGSIPGIGERLHINQL